MFLHVLSSFGVVPRHLVILAMFLGTVPHPGDAGALSRPAIEVFVTGDGAQIEEVAGVMVYQIGALAQLQDSLSWNLPGDPQAARDIVLARFARLDADLDRSLENAARGLARAMHYGIDRVPAIVFDGQAVVYGITDLKTARRIWRRWKKAQASQ